MDVGLERAGHVGDLVVNPWTMPRFSAVDVTRRSMGPPAVAATCPPSLRLNSVIGTVPLAVIDSVGDCCSVASRPMRLPA